MALDVGLVTLAPLWVVLWVELVAFNILLLVALDAVLILHGASFGSRHSGLR
jgi:hypothetical protein